MGEDQFTIKYQIREEDMQELESITFKKKDLKFLSHIIILTFVFLVFLIGPGAVLSRGIMTHMMILVVFYFIIFSIVGKKGSRPKGNSRWKEMVGTEQLYQITPDYIEYIGKNSRNKYPWYLLFAKEETEDYFYLFVSKKQALMLPKRAFGSIEQMNLLNSHIVSIPDYKQACKMI